MDLSNFKSTQFVSQYAGLPIEEFLQSASVLQKRSEDNQQQLDQLELMAANIQTMDIDEGVKQQRLATINNQMEALAASGAYEHATAQVRMQARDFARDEELMDASKNYAKLQKMREEAKAMGASQIQLQYLDNAIYAYNQGGGAAGGAQLEDLSFYKEANLAAEVDKILAGQKADRTVVASPDGSGYIVTETGEKVTEEALRSQAIAYLSGNPQFSRQIQDMAKLNIYNKNLQETGDPEAAYNTYSNSDAEMLGSEIDSVVNNLISPAVDKYSYKIYGKTLAADPLYGAGSKKQGEPDLSISSQFDMVDFGSIPKNAKEFRTQQSKLKSSIATKEAQYANALKQGNTNEANQILEDLNRDKHLLSRFDGAYDNYLSDIKDPKRKVGAVLHNAINSGQFNHLKQDAKNYNVFYERVLASSEFDAYASEYGLTTQDIREQADANTGTKLYQQGMDNRMFDGGTDFDSYLDDRGQTTSIQLYDITNEKIRERASVSLRRDAVKFYDQETTGEITENADFLQTLPYEVIGVSSMTEKGTLYAIKFPESLRSDKGASLFGDDAKDYAGKVMLVEPSKASNIDKVVGESMYAEAIGNVNTTGGAIVSGQVKAFGEMIGMPTRFSDELSAIGTSGARSNYVSLQGPGNSGSFANVSRNANGFYSAEIVYPNGDRETLKDLSYSEAMQEINSRYNYLDYISNRD